MSNQNYVAKIISDVTNMTDNEIIESLTVAPGESYPKIEQHSPRKNYAELAVDQGQQAIVQHVQREEKQARETEQVSRIAQAVAEAMRPETLVGKVKKEEAVRGEPITTVPESREVLQAQMKTVGTGGRKGVFSELPFEDEDVPEGYTTAKAFGGGYWAAPEADMEEVLELDAMDGRHEVIGHTAKKPEGEENAVVQVLDAQKVPVREQLVDFEGYDSAIAKAKKDAKEIGGSVAAVKTPEAITKRVRDLDLEEFKPTYEVARLVEDYRPESYLDSQGLRTVGVGFNMEQANAEKLWKQAGVDQDFDSIFDQRDKLSDINIQRLFRLTSSNANQMSRKRAEALGLDWDTFSPDKRAIISDAIFNTGKPNQWTKIFKANNLKNVLREARRKEGGKNTAGMDNRVARIGLRLGIIDSVAQAKALGLKLTSLSGFEVRKILAMREKKPAVKGRAVATAGVRG